MDLEQLEEQTEYFRYYVLHDGRIINIQIEEDGTEINVLTASGDTIGGFQFKALHEEDDDLENFVQSEPSYKLMHMMLEQTGENYKRCGIGKQCLTIHKELFSAPIYVSPPGFRNGDGSELVNHGPYFAKSMKRIRCIVPR